MIVRYSTVQYSTIQYGTVQYCTVQYSTVQYKRGADLYGPAPSLAYGIPGVTSERRLEGLCIHFLICCLLSVCNVFTTSILLHYN